MTEKTNHQIVTKRGTDDPDSMGYMSWQRNQCCCGWKGRKHYAYENFQMTELLKEALDHCNEKPFQIPDELRLKTYWVELLLNGGGTHGCAVDAYTEKEALQHAFEEAKCHGLQPCKKAESITEEVSL
jgi:hypothetical protein